MTPRMLKAALIGAGVLLVPASGGDAAADETPIAAAPLKSAKERLSDKASDEQRVNNCRVPLDRRGPKPRPDCPPGQAEGAPSANPAAAAR